MRGTKSRMPVRYQMVALLTGGSMINYLDRVNIAVAAPVMMESLGWDEAQFGIIFSAFLLGYALLQFPGGVLADRWNTHRLLILVCVGFSVFTALTPLGQLGFGLMLLLRFSVGMFESDLWEHEIHRAPIHGPWTLPPEKGGFLQTQRIAVS